MKFFVRFSALSFALGFAGQGSSHQLVCRDGRAFINTTYMLSDCRMAPKPQLQILDVKADGLEKGVLNIDVMFFPFTPRDPICDNPRGYPIYDSINLPLSSGEWVVQIKGRLLGTVTLAPGLTCSLVP